MHDMIQPPSQLPANQIFRLDRLAWSRIPAVSIKARLHGKLPQSLNLPFKYNISLDTKLY